MNTLKSNRLTLRQLTIEDADFIKELMSDPDWLKYIGDRGVRNKQDAITYIEEGPQTMYQQHDMGLLLVESLSAKTPIGLCGLLKRAGLTHPDLGFAFMPEYRKQGLAFEAAKLVLEQIVQQQRHPKILALTSLDNHKSINLLEKLGFNFKSIIRLEGSIDETRLFELSMKN
ncbi:MAG: GNAT family N-acetyltransferase [Paraglaciecola sp.]|uniref:GNAT family N-acetyltransferase n=1 Tax=Paraglaciecola sp. TaxID=1920173 RepID=UPI0032976535